MGNQIIKQPNGLYCKFSSVSDMIEVWNATREELIEDAVRYFRETVTRQIDEVLVKLDQENGRPYYQFTKTFEEALKETKKRAKPDHYQQVLEETKSNG
jgi:HSP90 family molecular chaperone